MAVTIKDVAALAGVSPSTVSRTCKNNPSISTETKEKVRKAMIELGLRSKLSGQQSCFSVFPHDRDYPSGICP